MKNAGIIIFLFTVTFSQTFSQNSWHSTYLGHSLTTVGVPVSGMDSNSLTYSPNSMLTGSRDGILWTRSDTIGKWSLLETSLPGIRCLGADSANGIMYLGTDNGIYRSMNGGITWFQMAFNGYPVVELEVNQINGEVLISVYKETPSPDHNLGIHASTDKGLTWRPVRTLVNCHDLLILDDSTYLACVYYSIIKITSNGLFGFWNAEDAQPYCVIVHPDGHILSGTNKGIFRKDVSSSNFVQVYHDSVNANYVLSMVVAKNGFIYAGTLHKGVFISTDTGLTWQQFKVGMYADELVKKLQINSAGYLFATGYLGSFIYETILPVNPPTAVKLVSPSNDTIGIISDLVLDWDTALTTTHYTLQVSKDSMFQNRIIDDSLLSLSSYSLNLELLQTETKYFWRVLGKNFAGKGQWSQVRKFTTGMLVNVQEKKKKKKDLGEFSLSIYPNPSSNILNFSLKSELDGTASIRIFNTLGEEVYSEANLSFGKGINSHSTNHDLPAGIYIMQAVINAVSGEQPIITQKILVLK